MGGKSEWNGAWSRDSPMWRRHPEVAADLQRDFIDGAFWMSFEDFASRFDKVSVCPATMPVPKRSRYSRRHQAVCCGRCGCSIQCLWVLEVSQDKDGIRSAPRWQRLRDGDLCLLCLRATSMARRAGRVQDSVGRHGTELQRKVPGVDYFPFEAGSGCLLPVAWPVCEFGQSCTRHNPEHHAAYDHPWMRPSPEVHSQRRAKRWL